MNRGRFKINDSLMIAGKAPEALHRFLNQGLIGQVEPSLACLFGATVYPKEFDHIIARWQDTFRGQWLNRKDGLFGNAS